MRISNQERNTNETKITVRVDIDGTGESDIFTGIGFFDHMLTLLARHGFMDLDIQADGDLFVDGHHTVEDVGILLGKCFREALGDKSGITRYGSVILPMDEALVLCAVDVSGRSYLDFDVKFTAERIGEMETELFEEFFRSLCVNGGFNLHIKCLSGKNNHHMAEAAFKAFARAFDAATSIDGRIEGALSTKGMLEV